MSHWCCGLMSLQRTVVAGTPVYWCTTTTPRTTRCLTKSCAWCYVSLMLWSYIPTAHCSGGDSSLLVYYGYATNNTVPNEKLCGEMHSIVAARKREMPSPSSRVVIRYLHIIVICTYIAHLLSYWYVIVFSFYFCSFCSSFLSLVVVAFLCVCAILLLGLLWHLQQPPHCNVISTAMTMIIIVFVCGRMDIFLRLFPWLHVTVLTC